MEGENAGTMSPGQGLWAENNGLALAQHSAVRTDTIDFKFKASSCTSTGGGSTARGGEQALVDSVMDHFDLSFQHFGLPPAGGKKRGENGLSRLSKPWRKQAH